MGRWLVGLLMGVSLLLSTPGEAAHPPLPPQAEVRLVVDEKGFPVAVAPGVWSATAPAAAFGDRCFAVPVVHADGRQAFVVLMPVPGSVGITAVFYVIVSSDNAIMEWAGNPHTCYPTLDVDKPAAWGDRWTSSRP